LSPHDEFDCDSVDVEALVVKVHGSLAVPEAIANVTLTTSPDRCGGLLEHRIEALELDSCVRRRELPINADRALVALLFPSFDFAHKLGSLRDAAVQALAGEDPEFDLGDV
jgi:hypothetical protein